MLSVTLLTGIVLSLLPSIFKLQYQQDSNLILRAQNTPFIQSQNSQTSFDFKVTPSSQTQETNFSFIHVDEENSITLTSDESNGIKNQEMLKQQTVDTCS